MERREFLGGNFTKDIPKYNSKNYQNLYQESSVDVDSGLEEYSGEWGEVQVKHLMRRSLFGFNHQQLNDAKTMSRSELITKLFEAEAEPAPPVNINPKDTVPVGETWINNYEMDDNMIRIQRVQSVRAWWSLLMLKQGISIREKMTLFLHNHFATEVQVYRIPHFAYAQNKLEREYATGNFKELVEKITIDPAMLRFLNGNQNTNRAPNENYGRELLELFTIGKGPLVELGDYTNYTEADVQTASKVLTGWSYRLRDQGDLKVEFRVGAHTGGSKTFSSAFGNKVINANGENEYKDLISMIFEQDATSEYICRKLYRWFVHNKIDEKVEKNMIKPMAKIFRDNNFELEPVLKALLNSAHFYDEQIVGCLIKNPIDFIYSMFKQFDLEEIKNSDNSFKDLRTAYNITVSIGMTLSAILQMLLLDPPGVAGWAAYYQEPAFNRLWLNSVTMPYRFQIGVGFIIQKLEARNSGDAKIVLKPELLKHIDNYDNQEDAKELVKQITEFLFPVALKQEQLDYLKLALVAIGEQDYVWAGMWTAYKSDPDNTNTRKAVEARLTNLFILTLSLAEYQIS